jgi:hypothetical protein
MLIVAYLLLILMVGAALVGIAIAGAVLGGILCVMFMIGFLFHETIQWLRK